MLKQIVPIAMLAIVFFVPAGVADHTCNGVVTQIDAGPQTLYMDDRSDDETVELWFYVESNGQSGLQRGSEALVPSPFDEVPIFAVIDLCGVPDGDLRLF